ncbi:hypothetical protein ACO1PK_14380 [Alishewanella sp. d11]|uniref:hypothetical protein n=1 Tax=Alishewanella sp. d11 TaxID=3414030 RepID=UPI003BF7C3F8
MSSKQQCITPELTAELRSLHRIMQAIDILADHPELAVVAYGKVWRFVDMLKVSMRYAYLAKLHGFDVEPFRRWYNREADIFQRHGVRWHNE